MPKESAKIIFQIPYIASSFFFSFFLLASFPHPLSSFLPFFLQFLLYLTKKKRKERRKERRPQELELETTGPSQARRSRRPCLQTGRCWALPVVTAVEQRHVDKH